MKAKRDLPTPGAWVKRMNLYQGSETYKDRPFDILEVTAVDHLRERIEMVTFIDYVHGQKVHGRRTTISFETWQTEERRYSITDAPTPPDAAPKSQERPDDAPATVGDLRVMYERLVKLLGKSQLDLLKV